MFAVQHSLLRFPLPLSLIFFSYCLKSDHYGLVCVIAFPFGDNLSSASQKTKAITFQLLEKSLPSWGEPGYFHCLDCFAFVVK